MIRSIKNRTTVAESVREAFRKTHVRYFDGTLYEHEAHLYSILLVYLSRKYQLPIPRVGGRVSPSRHLVLPLFP